VTASTLAEPGAIDLPTGFRDPARSERVDSILELVGNTPLVRVSGLVPEGGAKLYVKLDQFNYGGSSKDRIGINIVRQAIADGELKPGQRIVDFGAGNTAIGYALAGLATGHPVTIVANPTLSPEKANYLRFLGVDIVPGRVDVPRADPEHWAVIAARYEDEDPSNWWARQESATSNPASHIASTGPEIWQQTDGEVTHFLAAIATGGTVSGTGAYLKSRRPDVEVIATQFRDPARKSKLERHQDRDPGWEDLSVIDRFAFRTKAEVIDFGWRLVRRTGLALGPSSALSLLIASELAAELTPDATVVSFSADSARDYLTREYNTGWLRENGFSDIADAYDASGASGADA
jgi:cysteine synthase